MMKRLPALWAALGALHFAALGATAQERATDAALVVTAEKVSGEADDRAGDRAGSDEADVFAPGDVVQFRLVFTNPVEVPIRDVVFEDALPPELHYIASSATASRPDVRVEFSADDGASYALRPTVTVVIDGERVERPAPPETYTHIRWIVDGWVESEESVFAEFRAMAGEPRQVTPSQGPPRTEHPEVPNTLKEDR